MLQRKNMSHVFIYTANKKNASNFRWSGTMWREGIETEGGGEGVSYCFFPSPRLEEVKRAYCRVYNILFEVTILNLA